MTQNEMSMKGGIHLSKWRGSGDCVRIPFKLLAFSFLTLLFLASLGSLLFVFLFQIQGA